MTQCKITNDNEHLQNIIWNYYQKNIFFLILNVVRGDRRTYIQTFVFSQILIG